MTRALTPSRATALWAIACAQLCAATALAQDDAAPADPPTDDAASAPADALPAAAEGESTASPTAEAPPETPVDAAPPTPEASAEPPDTATRAPADNTTTRAPATPAGSRRIAVLDLKASEQDAPLANALAAVLTAELGRREGFVAVSRNEVRALLEQQSSATLLGCESERCAADLANLLDAHGVVTGSVDYVDGAHVVSLALIDPTGTAATRRLEWTWRGPKAELVTLANPAVHTLVLGADAAKLTGGLRIETEKGAEVIVNGESAGTAPLDEGVGGLPIGAHDVLIKKDGFVERRVSVAVAPSETTYSSVPLQALPFYSQGWFWGTVAATAGGILVAGASVTAFVIASSLPLPPKVIDVKADLPTAAQGLQEGGAR